MKKLSFLLLIFWALSIQAGIFSNLVSPAGPRKMDSIRVVMQLNIPTGILSLTASATPGKQVDAHILSCIGFGPSCQWQQWTGRNYTNFAITLAALFFPNAEETPFPWDMGAGLLLTAFNGYGIGIGYNAGLVPGKSINRLI